jgi:hypothetical protein
MKTTATISDQVLARLLWSSVGLFLFSIVWILENLMLIFLAPDFINAPQKIDIPSQIVMAVAAVIASCGLTHLLRCLSAIPNGRRSHYAAGRSGRSS